MSTTEAAHLAATTSTQICRKCDSLFQYSSIAGADNPENKTAGPSRSRRALALEVAYFFLTICISWGARGLLVVFSWSSRGFIVFFSGTSGNSEFIFGSRRKSKFRYSFPWGFFRTNRELRVHFLDSAELGVHSEFVDRGLVHLSSAEFI